MAKGKNTGNVTLKDIARATGFSANTVSRALADKSDISEKTKALIREKAAEMGYIANAWASYLRSGVSRNISIIVGDIANPHFAEMIKEMQAMFWQKGYNTIIFSTEESAEMEKQAIITSLGQNVDGIILCPAPNGEENIRFLQAHGKPFVMLGRHFSQQDASYVVCDDVNGGYVATKYLLGKGHRDILFLNGIEGISSSAERLEGYCKALEEAGIGYRSEFVKNIAPIDEQWKARMKQILLENQSYTAVLVFNDILAWKIVCILDELGKKVPEQCSVAGFDNIKYPYPMRLTSVTASRTTMAKQSVEILLKKLEGSMGEKEKCIVLETEVIEGQSVAAPYMIERK